MPAVETDGVSRQDQTFSTILLGYGRQFPIISGINPDFIRSAVSCIGVITHGKFC